MEKDAETRNILQSLVEKIISLDPSKVDERIETYTDIIAELYGLRKVSLEDSILLEYALEVVGEKDGIVQEGKIKQVIIVSVSKDRSWVSIKAPLYPLDKIKNEKKFDLLLELLRANNKSPEFAFDLDEKDIIGVTEDIYVPALTFDVFFEELMAVLRAIKYFYSDIAIKYELDVENVVLEEDNKFFT